MVNVVIPITSLAGGVSTQPESLRLPIQANRSDNVIATVVDGLRVRPPTEWLGEFVGFPDVPAKPYTIRTTAGDYVAVATDGGLKVFGVPAVGSEAVLRNVAGSLAGGSDFAYLETDNPEDDLSFLQVEDYTLILNRSKTVAASTDLTPAIKNTALVTIVSGSYSKRYQISIKHPSTSVNMQVWVHTWNSLGQPFGVSGAGNVAIAEQSVMTDLIAKELAYQLEPTSNPSTTSQIPVTTGQYGSINGSPLSPASWTVTRSGSTIAIERVDGTDFQITVEESQGSQSMALAYKKVQLFTTLPSHAPYGMKLEVEGDPEVAASSYWVEFVPTNTDGLEIGDFAEGSWQETVAPEVSVGLDPTTLPHALIRQANGEFRFGPLSGYSYVVSGTSYDVPAWEQRQVGDDETNPQIDLVGKKLTGMVFHAGRLGLLCATSLILSETRSPFSLYRTSVIDVVDTDRIEIKMPSVRSEVFRHVLTLGADLILVSDETQFVLRSEGPFAPNSVSLVAGGRYGSDATVAPIAVRDAVFIPVSRGSYGQVLEGHLVGDTRPVLTALPITSSADRYLPQPRRLHYSPQLDMVLYEATSDIYVYTFFIQGNEKVQQAWQRWTFPGSPTLRHLWFDGTYLYLIQDHEDGIHLNQMRLQPGADDDGMPMTHYDRRVSGSELTRTYSDGYTIIELPYTPSSIIEVIRKDGKAVRVDDIEGNAIAVVGNHSSDDIWIGEPYEWRHDLSKIYTIGQRQESVIQGTLRLESAKVSFSDSGPFNVHVTLDSGEESVSWFSGPYLGMGANYQKNRLTSGEFTFPIRARASECRISFRGRGPLAARLVSMDINARLTNQWGKRQ